MVALSCRESSECFQSASVPPTALVIDGPQPIELSGVVSTSKSCETAGVDKEHICSALEDGFEIRIGEFLSRTSPLGLESHDIEGTLDDSGGRRSHNSSGSNLKCSHENSRSRSSSSSSSQSSSHTKLEEVEQSNQGTDGVKTEAEGRIESFGSAILKSMQSPPGPPTGPGVPGRPPTPTRFSTTKSRRPPARPEQKSEMDAHPPIGRVPKQHAHPPGP